MVSLNSDMGESFGIHSFGNDDALVPLIDTANVACGFHAGDPTGIRETVEKALAAGVTVGAHPGLPDLVGFGRREMKLDRDETADLVRYQVGSLVAFLDAAGASLDHIKPHGSLYGMAARQEDIMDAICDVAVQYGVPVFGMAGTEHEAVANKRNVPFVAEFYVDLGYRADGSLIIARRPRATPVEDAQQRARKALTEGLATADTGEDFPMRVDSICVHSDTPNAVEVARAVRGVIDSVRG
ncbi:LamB/YcsF family protein [Pseudonocardia petroleophila]|uniref:5-oxoprolinase subunit PxpA n=1 Tax=Pseudonocardia petroleophila TaxID=37331 RepID=A0A7G7MLP1_9PSEU|nr:5-oxoprolinase subunit PxpA [Pseudonocardia petroleophila]QNG53702.1 5-oxoprolinase subunit PxpA [Pseudonocardia petroleophila]